MKKILLASILALTASTSFANTCKDLTPLKEEIQALNDLYVTTKTNSFVQGQVLKEKERVQKELKMQELICSKSISKDKSKVTSNTKNTNPSKTGTKEIRITIIEETYTY